MMSVSPNEGSIMNADILIRVSDRKRDDGVNGYDENRHRP